MGPETTIEHFYKKRQKFITHKKLSLFRQVRKCERPCHGESGAGRQILVLLVFLSLFLHVDVLHDDSLSV